MKQTLDQFLGNLDWHSYKEMRDNIIEKCKINAQILYDWRAGRSKVPELAREKINEIAGRELDYPINKVKNRTPRHKKTPNKQKPHYE